MARRTTRPPRSGRIFLTLQRGEQLHCFALRPAALCAALVAAILACALLLTGSARIWHDEAALLRATESPEAERIASLQAELERVSSSHVIASQLLEQRIGELVARQAQLEAQGATLSALAGQTSTIAKSATSVPLPPPRPALPGADTAQDLPAAAPGEPAPVRLRRMEAAMGALEDGHVETITRLGSDMRSRLARIEAAIGLAGLRPALLKPPEPAAGLGGPYVPLPDHPGDGPFARTRRDIDPLMSRHAALTGLLPHLPFRAPLATDFETTSGFGARTDPFHGRSAWHTGIDMREDYGAEVRATGAGTVLSAGWNGAYGQMVEIDHGNGLSTRYAHLSQIAVREGRPIAAGAVLGKIGSTGRSTGAHLHYEVRVNDEPVDPSRFLRAGEHLASLLTTGSQPRETAQ